MKGGISMNRERDSLKKEELLSSFIDDLNEERKPEIYKEEKLQEEDELLELLETVRAVKRLKGKNLEEFKLKPNTRRAVVEKRSANIRKTVLAASVLIVVFLAGNMFPSGLFNLEKSSPSDPGQLEMKIAAPNTNVVYAMERAYEELEGYSGKIEILSESNGVIESRDEIEIKFQKPDKYYFVHKYDKVQITKISDGDKLYIIDGDQVTVDYLHPAKELWRFHIGNQIEELKRVSEINQTGMETVLGRETLVYEFRYSELEPLNRIWIDVKTNLPIKQELNMNGNRRLTNKFVEIQFNPAIDKKIFSYEAKLDKRVKMVNKKSSLEEAKKEWKVAGSFPGLLENSFTLSKVIELEKGWYDYSLSFKGKENTKEYLDIYIGKPMSEYYMKESELGKLKDGWVEINREAVNVFKVYIGRSSFVKWVTPESEIVMVGNVGVEGMIETLEKLTGEKVSPASVEDMKKFGVEEPVTKEGH
jgi:outer membrane lipoprotein-sorting protein